MHAAVKRLTRDYRGLMLHPIPGAIAEPLEDNMLEWHGNIMGPKGSAYENVIFHVIFEFSHDYPMTAPKAFFPIKFARGKKWGAMGTDNKGRQTICMNIFSNFENLHSEWKGAVGEGWSPSMDISTILVQIQAGFLDGDFISLSKNSVKATLKDCTKFKCNGCGHDGSDQTKWQPLISPWSDIVIDNNKVEKTEVKKPSFQPVCYATHQNLVDDAEEEPIMGFGLNLKYDQDTLLNIYSPYEYISQEAYETGHRRTSLKYKFDAWIPVYVNNIHWIRAQPIFENQIQTQMRMTFGGMDTVVGRIDTREKIIVQYFATVMRSMFEAHQNKINEHFINGYFAFYRTLISYEAELKDYANQQIMLLLETSITHIKAPDHTLDEWMMFIFLSRYEWNQVAASFLFEVEIRNVNDYLEDHPELVQIWNPNSEAERALIVFRAYRPILTKIGFYIGFHQQICGLIFSEIDYNNGMLDTDTKQLLIMILQEVKNLGSWQDFYMWIGFEQLQIPTNIMKSRQLLSGLLIAKKLGYITGTNNSNDFSEIKAILNCPNRQNNYHICSHICIAKYGNVKEKISLTHNINEYHSNLSDQIMQRELKARKNCWLRQSH